MLPLDGGFAPARVQRPGADAAALRSLPARGGPARRFDGDPALSRVALVGAAGIARPGR